jgi:hypothetical protein
MEENKSVEVKVKSVLCVESVGVAVYVQLIV